MGWDLLISLSVGPTLSLALGLHLGKGHRFGLGLSMGLSLCHEMGHSRCVRLGVSFESGICSRFCGSFRRTLNRKFCWSDRKRFHRGDSLGHEIWSFGHISRTVWQRLWNERDYGRTGPSNPGQGEDEDSANLRDRRLEISSHGRFCGLARLRPSNRGPRLGRSRPFP
jgi:hypothetical protein